MTGEQVVSQKTTRATLVFAFVAMAIMVGLVLTTSRAAPAPLPVDTYETFAVPGVGTRYVFPDGSWCLRTDPIRNPDMTITPYKVECVGRDR